MSERSAIGWTESTWNCLAGCTRVSAGCDHCYAAQLAATKLRDTPSYRGLAVVTTSGRAAFNGTVRLLDGKLHEPLRWRTPRRVFVNSMSDVFHDGVPDSYIDQMFAVMGLAWKHHFQVLTKRPERMCQYMTTVDPKRILSAALQEAELHWGPIIGQPDSGVRWINENAPEIRRAFEMWPLPNVWLGVSAEDQERWDERVEVLGRTPAAVRFVSAEPLLGPIDPGNAFDPPVDGSDYQPIDWLIIGGETGPKHRPMQVEWAEALAASAGCAVFVKQDSGPRPGKQGRLSDALWARKEYPTRVPA